MFRAAALSLPLVCAGLPAALTLPAPAIAQTATTDCAAKPKKKRGLGAFGKMAGSLAGSMLSGRTPSFRVIPNAFGLTLTNAFAELLDKGEQKQAACATDSVIERGERGEVGATQSWTSESRASVTGTSTVVAANTASDGTRCMNLTDVVIIEGEETTVSKRMCKGPGQSRYTVAQV